MTNTPLYNIIYSLIHFGARSVKRARVWAL
jgi:hypothetical protein